jgi:hypothetical protein
MAIFIRTRLRQCGPASRSFASPFAVMPAGCAHPRGPGAQQSIRV